MEVLWYSCSLPSTFPLCFGGRSGSWKWLSVHLSNVVADFRHLGRRTGFLYSWSLAPRPCRHGCWVRIDDPSRGGARTSCWPFDPYCGVVGWACAVQLSLKMGIGIDRSCAQSQTKFTQAHLHSTRDTPAATPPSLLELKRLAQWQMWCLSYCC